MIPKSHNTSPRNFRRYLNQKIRKQSVYFFYTFPNALYQHTTGSHFLQSLRRTQIFFGRSHHTIPLHDHITGRNHLL